MPIFKSTHNKNGYDDEKKHIPKLLQILYGKISISIYPNIEIVLSISITTDVIEFS